MITNNKGWQIKSLGDICTITTGDKDVNEGDVNGQYLFFTCAAEPLRSANYSFEGEAILLPGNGANVGLTLYYNGKFEAYQRTYVLNNFSADVKYVYFHLRDRWKKSQEKKQYGSATNYIRYDNIASYKIPLPPLPIQKQIAEILEKADQAKQKRKEANKLTDDFLQSVFIEMFGDPVKNPKGWNLTIFCDLGKLARGKSKHRPRNAPFLLGGPYPLVQTSEIVNSSIYINSYTQTYSEEGLKQSKMWPKGTLCISIAANIGFTAIMNFDACFPDSVVGFIPNDKVIVEYIHFYFRFIRKQLDDSAPQSAQKNINLEILDGLKIPIPPRSLQQQFAEIVNKTEALREKQKQSEQELENLFQSLMQKAFKGELVS